MKFELVQELAEAASEWLANPIDDDRLHKAIIAVQVEHYDAKSRETLKIVALRPFR